MNKQTRWNMISELCKADGSMRVNDLISAVGASPATIRRDLREMEDLGILTRYHGGAKINHSRLEEPVMSIKHMQNLDLKRHIALAAARKIKDNEIIYLDAGSTIFEMLQFINASNITIVTIGIQHLKLLGEKKIHTIVLGGNLYWNTEALTGSQTIKQMEDLYFDKAFLGTNGIHVHGGFTTSNEQEANTKAMAIKHAEKAYVLADSSKFNKLLPFKFADLKDVIVLTNEVKDFDKSLLSFELLDGTHN